MDNELNDLFRFENGERVRTLADWRRRRQELLKLVLEIEYGRLPPAPPGTAGEFLHRHDVARYQNAHHHQYRLVTRGERPFAFLLDLLIPEGAGPFPVVLNGDGCWRYLTDSVTREVLRRGNILAAFNRVELAPDIYTMDRVTGLYRVYPEGDFGSLAAWAWGYHRCVDFLLTLDNVDPARVAIVGHSRGGKAVLLAGATDERIALTAPNNSGCGGAGCFRRQGPKSETMADILGGVGYWFSPRLKEYIGREQDLPFDQHYLKALVAPRALLSTEALGDLWANPTGTWQTHLAAREAYRFLGAEQRIGIWFREGEHDHGDTDWAAFLDFMDWQFRDRRPARRFDENPFPDLPRAFEWSAPEQAKS
jgi:hypothetical protein